MFNSKRMRKLMMAAALGVSAMLMMTGCGGDQEKAADDKAAPLKVGSTIDFAPFEFQGEGDKEYQGFDMDLIRAVGKEIGRETNISNIGFDGLIPALEAKNIDLIISGMTITEERKNKVNFSDPYFTAGLTIVVKEDNTDINSFKDLEGKKIAVQIGTTSSEKAKQIPNADVKEFNTPPECLMELANGGADAVINDKPVNDYIITRDAIKGLKSLPEQLEAGDYGIAIAKGNEQLLNDVNGALKKLKENGEYEKIRAKWFGEASK